MTDYLILAKTANSKDENAQWEEVAQVGAASSRAALRHYLGTDGEGGEFVAVPARSWRPVKVAVETALKFSS